MNRVIGVRLLATARSPLALRHEDGGIVAELAIDALHRERVETWLGRQRVEILQPSASPAAAPFHEPLCHVPTVVVCCDARALGLAQLYASAVGARMEQAASHDDLTTVAARVPSSHSLTLFLLNDALTEDLLHAVARATRRTTDDGRSIAVGFMVALTVNHLAWLVLKTLHVLTSATAADPVGFGRYEADGGTSTRFRDPETGRTYSEAIADPWISDRVSIFDLRGHGVPFDALLGDVALCGHLEPALPAERLVRSPVCFHDGNCFRLNRAEDAPTRVVRAIDTTPLWWFLNSCGAIPLADSAFGDATGYAFGLLAGSAVAVIGPFLTLPTNGWLNRIFEALVATGASAGEIVHALCAAQDPDANFQPFILLGSPDVGAMPQQKTSGTSDDRAIAFQIAGRGQTAVRLTLPPSASHTVGVVGDDGGEVWEEAGCHWLQNGEERELLVMTPRPIDEDAWLVLSAAGKDPAVLREAAEEIARRLGVLSLYPFAKADADDIAACRAVARRLASFLAAPHLVRSRQIAAILRVDLTARLNRLQESVASNFIAYVVARDFSFDRESHNGFEPGAFRRVERRCVTCGSALFETIDRWLEEPSYQRRKDVCPNCIGVSMVLHSSPLQVTPPSGRPGADVAPGVVRLRIENREPGFVRAWVAVAPRHGPSSAAFGPVAVDLPALAVEERAIAFPLEQLPPGVLSLRVLVLCEGAADLHSCKMTNPRTLTIQLK